MTTTATTTTRPSFARWALGVLAPLAVIEACVALFAGGEWLLAFIEPGLPLVYAPIFLARLALGGGCSVPRSLAIAGFALVMVLMTYMPPLPGGPAIALLMVGAFVSNSLLPFLPGEVVAMFIAGAALGLLLALLQWIALAFPAEATKRWITAHCLGAALGGAVVGPIVAALFTAGMHTASPGDNWAWSPLPFIAALPHLYMTWRALGSDESTGCTAQSSYGARNPFGRMAFALLFGYLLVAGGRVATNGPSWYAVIWPYEVVAEIGFVTAPVEAD